MAPSKTRRPKPRTRTKPRRIHYKKQLVKLKNIQGSSTMEDLACISSSSSSSSTTTTTTSSTAFSNIKDLDFEDADLSTTACSTPKAQRFRIPDIVICPPAPKKQRMISNCSSSQRTPVAFFAPPDLELFFFFALQDIPV